MHPTDTLLSLSHARIARAAAAGPRRATQPTAQTDRQHLAQRDQASLHAALRSSRHSVGATIYGLRSLSQADADLSGALDAAL